jgi:hypothetical protein
MTPTFEQFQHARTVVQSIMERRRAINLLRGQLDARDSTVDANDAVRCSRFAFRDNPNLLAGTLEILRKSRDPETVRLVNFWYGWLLEEMLDPLVPGARPRKVDFTSLTYAARPYLLGPFLNIVVGREFARLSFQGSHPEQGLLVYETQRGPSDPAIYRANLPTIASWLNSMWVPKDHTWTVAGHGPNHVTLQRREGLPRLLPFTDRCLKPGQLFLGFEAESHEPFHIPFADLTSGTLIPGAAGSGKTNGMHVILRSLFANLDQFAHVYLIDGKEGVAFHRYAKMHPKVAVLWDEQEVWDLTSRLVAEMQQRNARQREAGIDKQSRDLVALVIDEMATYTHKPSVTDKALNKRHGQFVDELAMLARKGRSVGFKLMVSAQEISEAHVPLPVRNNCQTIISFRIGIDQHATMLFGQLTDLPADPRRLERGFALIKNSESGSLSMVKFPVIAAPGARP